MPPRNRARKATNPPTRDPDQATLTGDPTDVPDDSGVGGIVTDDGGRPVTDDGGRPLNRGSADR